MTSLPEEIILSINFALPLGPVNKSLEKLQELNFFIRSSSENRLINKKELFEKWVVAYIDKLLQSFSPAEVLYQRNKDVDFENSFGDKFHTYCLEDWVFTAEFAEDILLKHFKSFKGFLCVCF